MFGAAYGDRYAERVADRVGESLQAASTVEEGELSLVRGRLALAGIRARRDDDVGRLALDVSEVRCEMLPLGLALADRTCRELAITGLRLDVSTPAVFKVKRPKRAPIRADSVVIEDAVLELSPTGDAGVARVSVKLERADAGATTFKTPLSWLFALRTLRASVATALGSFELAYDEGELRVSGGPVGSGAIVLSIVLPIADPADDPHAELQRIVAFGREVMDRVVKQRITRLLGTPTP